MSGGETGKPHVRASGAAAAVACGARKRDGAGCTQPAMANGRCRLHGGKSTGTPLATGKYSRYSVIKSEAARELREHFEKDPDPLDLLPDVLELRVRIADFCNRYDEFSEALIAWHASFNPEFDEMFGLYLASRANWQTNYEQWRDKWAAYRQQVEKVQHHYSMGWPEPPDIGAFPMPPEPPDPAQFEGKPRRITDILSAARFLSDAGAMVERIRKFEQERGLTIGDLNEILKRHSLELMAVASEKIRDDNERDAFLAEISDRWDAIPIAVERPRRKV